MVQEGAPHINSYYAATANETIERPGLDGHADTDVCIIGAGFSGIATALSLLEQGYRVIVLEAAKVGWGATGRNGGQLVNSYCSDLDDIKRKNGQDSADALGQMMLEGGQIIRERIERFNIQCDLRDGCVYAAFNKKQMRELERRFEIWRKHGHFDTQLLDQDQLKDYVNTDIYSGGLVDRKGGHLHPLNLVLGEARAVEDMGGIIHENSRVTYLEPGSRPVVHTEYGKVQADYVAVCGNAYLGQTVPPLANRIMPVNTQIIATEPLGEAVARQLMPAGACVEDCSYILDYYRMSADNRLLFGGGMIYGGASPDNIIAELRPHMTRTFPQLVDARIDYAWAGNVAFTLTLAPHLGQIGRAHV